MKTLEFTIQKHKCICTEDNIHIVDSYDVPDEDIFGFLHMLYAAINGEITYTRSIESWTKEWISHNKLYRHGLFKSHTKDVDLNEDESGFRLFIYSILGG